MFYSEILAQKCLNISLHEASDDTKVKVLTNNINVSRSDKVIKTLKQNFSSFSNHTSLFLHLKCLHILVYILLCFITPSIKNCSFIHTKNTQIKQNWLHSQPKLLSLWQFSEFSNNIFSTKYSEIKRNNNKEENIFSWNSLAIIMVYIRDRMNNDGRSKSTFIWEKMQKSSGMLSTLPQLSL